MLNIIVYNQTIIRCYFEMYGKHAIYPSIINLLTDFFPVQRNGVGKIFMFVGRSLLLSPRLHL